MERIRDISDSSKGKRTALSVISMPLAILIAIALVVCSQTLLAFASTTKQEWTVDFTGTKMESSGTANITKEIKAMQPGDSAVFDVTLYESYDGAADWYMKNSVLSSMERTFRNSGGAYSYSLIYTDPYGSTKTILSNKKVSGEGNTNGLFDATTATGEWFYLDTLPHGASGHVVLSVGIDGHTHGNTYFDSSAALKLQFAAEPTSGGVVRNPGNNYGESPRDGSIVSNDLNKAGDLDLITTILAVALGAAAVLSASAGGNILRKKRMKKGRA